MSTLIETHAHLYDEKYKREEWPAIISNCTAKRVTKIYLPNLSLTTITPMLDLAKAYPTICYPMLGLHPCEVKENFKAVLDKMETWLAQQAFVGIGEVGIDLYWDTRFYKEQVAALEMQTKWALDAGLPLILHARNSLDEVIKVVEKNQTGKLRGIFHCFEGSLTQAQKIIDLGFYIGIGGRVTYAQGVMATAKAIDLSHIVLETDSPYLAPAPFRGKRNDPSYLPLVAEQIAMLKEVNMEEVARITTLNAKSIFAHNRTD
ncbi:MAG: TatD family hydrolase [Bacteroidota bacterium]